jgi:hypothetical protein
MIGAAFVSAAVFPAADAGVRLLVMALAAGVVAAIVRDWRVSASPPPAGVGFVAGVFSTRRQPGR